MGLVGDLLHGLYDIGSDRVRYLHHPSNQLRAWPFKILLELLRGPEISC